MNILITGGAGFIGSHLSLYLYEKGNKITIIDDFSTGNNNFLHNYEVIGNDINNLESLKKILFGRKFDFLIHLASKSIVSESFINEDKYTNNNIMGTKNILKLCLFLKINKIIFSSTAAVYGDVNNEMISEEFPTIPINPYGLSKIKAENILKKYGHKYKIDVLTFRFFNASGGDPKCRVGETHIPETHLIPKLIQFILKNKNDEFVIYGDNFNTFDGFAVRDYLHVTDICSAIYLGINWLYNKNGYFIINLGSAKAISVIQLIRYVEVTLGKKIKFRIENSRIGEPGFLLSKIDKANSLLGWKPLNSSIKKIINDTFKWQSKFIKKT